MKNIFTTIILFIATTFVSSGQSTDAGVTGNSWGSTKYLGWNNTNGANPLFTKTNNVNRMRLNGNQNTLINFANQNTSGYLGIAPSGYFTNNSPWSMLHLEGPNNTIFNGEPLLEHMLHSSS